VEIERSGVLRTIRAGMLAVPPPGRGAAAALETLPRWTPEMEAALAKTWE
jgi:hypothetical protein